MSEFHPVQRKPEPLQPETLFTHKDKGEGASFSVQDFWVWAASDVLNNTLRGIVAELHRKSSHPGTSVGQNRVGFHRYNDARGN